MRRVAVAKRVEEEMAAEEMEETRRRDSFAGMETVAALFGYIDAGDNPEDWNADHYIHQASELHGLIDTLAENYL